jgi:hypothetical protein
MHNGSGIITATGYVRRMRGGTQSHLLRCSDGKDYVVKFSNNPQGIRILANELIFSNLATSFGFSVPRHIIVTVEDRFVRSNPQLSIWIPPDRLIACESGLHFGSEYVISPLAGRIIDYFAGAIPGIRNSQQFAGMLVLDKWACNWDQRQAVLWKHSRQRKYTASFIDHGWCFGAAEWEFLDRWVNGVFCRNEVYAAVIGWESFEPWLSQLESLEPDVIWRAVENTPPNWYQSNWSSLEHLAETLIARRGLVRNLIEQFRLSSRHPFPGWRDSQVMNRNQRAS